MGAKARVVVGESVEGDTMSGAHDTVPGYLKRAMRGSSLLPELMGGAIGTDGSELIPDRSKRQLKIRQAAEKYGLSPLPPPPYEEMPASLVSDAWMRVRREALRAQVVGGIVAVIVGLVLFLVSANGLVIAVATYMSATASGYLVWRHRSRRARRTRALASLASGSRTVLLHAPERARLPEKRSAA